RGIGTIAKSTPVLKGVSAITRLADTPTSGGLLPHLRGDLLAIKNAYNDIAQLVPHLLPMNNADRGFLKKALADYPVEIRRLTSTPVGDVVDSSFASTLNYFNRLNDTFFR
ncbi:MAG: hypothetical protein GTN93_13195, partial [Anaerolineae bacterium]|nr:hypothetical protein [Anaerolineae bacterium]